MTADTTERAGPMWPQRVALVVPDLEPNTISYFSCRFAQALCSVGAEVAIYGTSDRFDLGLLPDGATFYGGSPGRSITSAPRLYRFFQTWRPDVVLPMLEQAIPGCRIASAMLRARGTRCPVVPTLLHPPSLGDPDHSLISRPFVKRRIVGRPALAFAISTGTADDSAAVLGLGRDTIEVVPPAYDAAAVVDTTAEPGPLRLVTVSRLVPLKRHDVLLAAVRLLVDRGIDVRLVVVGDGESRSSIEAAIVSLGLGDVVGLTGRVGDPSMVVQTSQVYVSASDEEGFGMAIVEAMAGGIPVVAVDARGGGPRFIAGGDGLALVTRGSTTALADALEALTLPEARQRLRVAGLARAQTFTTQAVGRRASDALQAIRPTAAGRYDFSAS